MKFYLSIKSHIDSPDFEATIEADNRGEAIEKLFYMYEFSRDTIDSNLTSEKEFGEKL